MNDRTLQVITAAAESLSAIGTTAAVIAALYLARRQTGERVSVRTAKVGIAGSSETYLQIRVTNICLRDVTLSNLSWQVGRFRPEHFFQKLPLNALSSILPVKLAPSETATFLYPWNAYVENSASFRKAMRSRVHGPFGLSATKCLASLSSGVIIRARVDRYLTKQLLMAPLDEGDGPAPQQADKGASTETLDASAYKTHILRQLAKAGNRGQVLSPPAGTPDALAMFTSVVNELVTDELAQFTERPRPNPLKDFTSGEENYLMAGLCITQKGRGAMLSLDTHAE